MSAELIVLVTWLIPISGTSSLFHHRLVINNLQTGFSSWNTLRSSFMSCISDIYSIVAGIHVLVNTAYMYVYKCVTLLNLHNSLVFFPLNFCTFSHGFISHYLPVQEFQLIIVFARNNCFLLFCWELSYSEIMLIKHNYGNRDEGNFMSHSGPPRPHTLKHSLIARVEILLQVYGHWFYYLEFPLDKVENASHC